MTTIVLAHRDKILVLAFLVLILGPLLFGLYQRFSAKLMLQIFFPMFAFSWIIYFLVSNAEATAGMKTFILTGIGIMSALVGLISIGKKSTFSDIESEGHQNVRFYLGCLFCIFGLALIFSAVLQFLES